MDEKVTLSPRKKRILQVLVDEYISTATPVSSKSITENYLTDVSSATVRNELSALEEMGYVEHLHTSSGRVPSPLGYKLYVNELMQKKHMSRAQLDYLREVLGEHTDNLEQVVKRAVKVISEMTDYTSVAMTNLDPEDKIEAVKLLKIKEGSALLLIVTEERLLKDNIIALPAGITDESVEAAGKMLSRMLEGKRLNETAGLEEQVAEEFGAYREVFGSVLEAIKKYCKKESEVVLEGEEKILAQPEYFDVEKMRNFLTVVADKDNLARVLKDSDGGIEVSLKIGAEAGISEDCSVVTATYTAGGVNLGTYGVIGPMRMDYKRVITVLESVGKVLEELLK
ncbi:MAG: heat-inducible transcription repressor HrcA [Clostridia bacterium]|nr:heat-inducible transcription repressor HrcA [Clostridia bacterium]